MRLGYLIVRLRIEEDNWVSKKLGQLPIEFKVNLVEKQTNKKGSILEKVLTRGIWLIESAMCATNKAMKLKIVALKDMTRKIKYIWTKKWS